MSNNSNIAPSWAGFRKLWVLVAIILFILLFILWIIGYGPGGEKCNVEPTIVEKIVEKEKLVDNPEHLARIAVLEKENALIAGLKQENNQIAGFKTNIAELTKSSGLVAGLQAKVKALEAVDVNFEPAALMSKISALEADNASIDSLRKHILSLEANNAESNDERNTALIKEVSDLKAKVAALEAVDVNFVQAEDNTELLQKINGLEVENLVIPTLKTRIETLTTENSLIDGLKAKVAALEAVDVNFVQAEDNTELLQKINGLEVENLVIPTLKTRIETLTTENSLIAGLKAKVTALEAVDVNFIQAEDNTELVKKINDLEAENAAIPTLRNYILKLEEGNKVPAPVMQKIPDTAKLFFDSGSSRFPTVSKESLEEVIVYLKSNANSKVSLAGFHDASGNVNWNSRLATKRSNRVKQILLDSGISESRIKVLTPSQTLGTGSPEEARRVEIQVHNYAK